MATKKQLDRARDRVQAAGDRMESDARLGQDAAQGRDEHRSAVADFRRLRGWR
ncbi:hypothetical protein Q0Z83_059830 [Actinoplanes sichuanensis]|uniref:Uncharacterized protein n=1 Tax=Actinoplanes sichuanensis TaxID=512349 RepID=A0ABW4A7F6_9ACTN|nr:hypothetical protein [Actinoplanes sichuanensis]BEL07792.1 hypothetical protein Q0Z83_059830 [Actinoplanes sichuanensis]